MDIKTVVNVVEMAMMIVMTVMAVVLLIVKPVTEMAVLRLTAKSVMGKEK